MKKRGLASFQQFYHNLPDAGKLRVGRYFSELHRRVLLPEGQKEAIRRDLEAAVLVLLREGVELREALDRLSLRHLGDFYSTAPLRWYPLDDAAKIYPLSMSHREMKMFRLSAYLDRDVEGELLQVALLFAIKRFPSFATTVKKGFFWHYIDAARRRFTVAQEAQIPFSPMNVSINGAPSFRVVYYKNRISAEFFHILTDASGGMIFLKTLVGEYLRLNGVKIAYTPALFDPDGPPDEQETANGFSRPAVTQKRSGFVDKPAVQMEGRLASVLPCQILHFEIDSAALRTAARRKGTTVTALMLAMMFVAVRAATEKPRGRIQIQVPVNMRKFEPHRTLRNFSMYCSIRLSLEEITSVDELLPEISRQLREGASREKMNEMMNAASAMVRALRWIPLAVKRPFARVITGFLSDRVFTSTLSNIGVVELPEELRPYIRKMDFVLGGGMLNRASCAMVTVGSTAVFSVTKLTQSPRFEQAFAALLQEQGLPYHVTGSEPYGR